MDTIEAYVAIQDEIWRLNAQIHRTHIKPTVYREGRTYAIMSAFLESDILWYSCYELITYNPYVHMRVPFIREFVIYCDSPHEWEHILVETGVVRHSYLENTTQVTRKLRSKPLTN